MPTLSLSIVEIIVLMLGAIVLGITIHFFIISRKNLRSAVSPSPKNNKAAEEWKARYYSDMELKEKELAALRQSLEEEKENSNIYTIEAEEQRQRNKKLKEELQAIKQNQPAASAVPNFADQLRLAQTSLTEQHEKLGQLLDEIGFLKAAQEKHEYLKQENEELQSRVMELETKMLDKEREMSNMRQKAHLTKEMSSMLDNAYTEFNVLQSKIEKLELQANSSKVSSVELDNLKEENLKLQHELDDNKLRLNAATTENQQLRTELMNAEDDLKATIFLRQQLEKKVSYLEELNSDLHAVSDTNKKLEGQIKRIGELESMLNMLAEERDQLMKRQGRE